MKKTQSGFTLVEIMIVVGIIAILAGMFLVGAAKFRANANVSRVKSDIQKIEALQELYATRMNGKYASDLQELQQDLRDVVAPTNVPGTIYKTSSSGSCAEILDSNMKEAFGPSGSNGWNGTEYCLNR